LIVRNEKYRVNFWRQLEQPFLIFESPTLAFEIIAAVFHQTDLTSLLKSMSKDLQDLKDDTLRLEGQLESNKAMVETQKGIYDSFLEDMQHYPLYETLLSEVKGLTALQDTMQDLSAKTAEISKVDNYLAPLQELLSRSNGIMQNIEPLVTDLQVLNELASDWDQSSLDAFKIRNGLSSTTDLLSSLAPTLTQLEAQIEETKSLMMFYNEANRLSQDTHTKQTVLDRCQEDLKAYLDELSGFDICPLCQQNLTGHDHAASSTPEI
jgi:DNA repair exonuclease SbcCD ATPase subunit